MEAILMVEKMDKTWSVIIRCLEGKKAKGDCDEGRPGEAVVKILGL
jgi:hypothetical protein